MNVLEENLAEFKTNFPKSWSFLWSPEEAEKISEEHKDQIHFLNKKGTEIVKEYLNSSKMLAYSTGTDWSPFTSNLRTAIFGLNLNESRDTAAIQMKITVPVDEPAGTKESVVLIVASAV